MSNEHSWGRKERGRQHAVSALLGVILLVSVGLTASGVAVSRTEASDTGAVDRDPRGGSRVGGSKTGRLRVVGWCLDWRRAPWARLRRGRSKSSRANRTTGGQEVSDFADAYVDYLLGFTEVMPALPTGLSEAKQALATVRALNAAYGCERREPSPAMSMQRVALRRQSLATVIPQSATPEEGVLRRLSRWILARPQRPLERSASGVARRAVSSFLARRPIDSRESNSSTYRVRAFQAVERPYVIIGLAVVTSLTGAALIATGHTLAAAAILTVSVGLEFIDGEAAKLARDARRAVYIDYLTDRLGDIALLGAVSFYYWHRDPIVGQMALLAMAAAQFGSYVRAEAIALRFEAPRSILSRAQRLVAIVLGLWLTAAFAGDWPMRVGLGIAAASTLWVIIERLVHVIAQGGQVTPDEAAQGQHWADDTFVPTILDKALVVLKPENQQEASLATPTTKQRRRPKRSTKSATRHGSDRDQ